MKITEWFKQRRDRARAKDEAQQAEFNRKKEETTKKVLSNSQELIKLIRKAGFKRLRWCNHNFRSNDVSVYFVHEQQLFRATMTLKGGLNIERIK